MMENFFVDLAAVAVVLGIMIIGHEFGHFAAANLFDVRVEQFAILTISVAENKARAARSRCSTCDFSTGSTMSGMPIEWIS